MSNKKITELAPLTDSQDNDVLVLVDASDLSGGSLGTNKKTTKKDFFKVFSNQQDDDGERIILQNLLATDSTDSAKTMIAFKDVNGLSKAWLVAHKYSSASSGGALHEHFSIETSRADGGLYTRLEFPYDKDVCEAAFNLCNLTINRNTGLGNGQLLVQGGLEAQRGLILKDLSSSGTEVRGYASVHPVSFQRSNGTSAAQTIVTSGNFLGQLAFKGYDGDSYQLAAQIIVKVDGTAGVADMPGRIEFHTTPDGSATPLERMRLSSGGNLGIKNDNPPNMLTVGQPGTIAGSVAIAGTTTGYAILDTSQITTSNKTFTFPNQSGNLSTVTSGTAVPATTPANLGQIYIKTDTAKVYISTGVASSADWTIVN